MTTINELARELGFGEDTYGLRAFSDDLLKGLGDTDEIAPTTEAIIREACAVAEAGQND